MWRKHIKTGQNCSLPCVFKFIILPPAGKELLNILQPNSHNWCMWQMHQELQILQAAKWITAILFPRLLYLMNICSHVNLPTVCLVNAITFPWMGCLAAWYSEWYWPSTRKSLFCLSSTNSCGNATTHLDFMSKQTPVICLTCATFTVWWK